MGDRHADKHRKKNPKRTPEQIKEDRIKRKQYKEEIKNGKTTKKD